MQDELAKELIDTLNKLNRSIQGRSVSGAPVNAKYLTTTTDAVLTDNINLGALTTGLLKSTVAAGVATISIITDNSADWNTAYSWGNHAGLYAAAGHTHAGVYQPVNAGLTAIAALSSADGNIIVGSAGGWVAESGATARTSLGVGTGDSPTFAGATINGAFTNQPSADATFKVETAGGEMGLYTYRNFAGWDGAFWISYRAHGTKAAPTIVSNGDRLGSFLFRGYDGNGWTSAANIIAEVDGTPGDGDMPGRIIFLTTPNGSDAEVERMRISSDGVITMTGSKAGDIIASIVNTSNTGYGLRVQNGLDSQYSFGILNAAGNSVNIMLYGDGIIDTLGYYKVDGTQVVGNRVIDARCDDAINSGDAQTDGVIDSLRDAMIAHGLIAAA